MDINLTIRRLTIGDEVKTGGLIERNVDAKIMCKKSDQNFKNEWIDRKLVQEQIKKLERLRGKRL